MARKKGPVQRRLEPDGERSATASPSRSPESEIPLPAGSSEKPSEKRFRVVGIGASAGGLEALTEFSKAMRPDSGMAFVVVSHLDPDHKSALGEILSRLSAMPVRQVEGTTTIAPDHVYVMPPDRDMVIEGGVLQLTPRAEAHATHRPIDMFLRSLARDRPHESIGVILSGTGTDGTLGLRAIKEAGGAHLRPGRDGPVRWNAAKRGRGRCRRCHPVADADRRRVAPHLPPLPAESDEGPHAPGRFERGASLPGYPPIVERDVRRRLHPLQACDPPPSDRAPHSAPPVRDADGVSRVPAR